MPIKEQGLDRPTANGENVGTHNGGAGEHGPSRDLGWLLKLLVEPGLTVVADATEFDPFDLGRRHMAPISTF
jgi:hypothetical protein